MKITAIIFSAFVAVVPLTSLHAQTTSALRSGIDLEYIDDGVRAQDDFYRYSQGSDAIKKGDQLFVLVPDTEELAVEME